MVIEARLVIPKTEIQAADKDRNDKEYPHKQGIPSHTNISHRYLAQSLVYRLHIATEIKFRSPLILKTVSFIFLSYSIIILFQFLERRHGSPHSFILY